SPRAAVARLGDVPGPRPGQHRFATPVRVTVSLAQPCGLWDGANLIWPREESNLRTQIRSLPLYPLSYGAAVEDGSRSPAPGPRPGVWSAAPLARGPGARGGGGCPPAGGGPGGADLPAPRICLPAAHPRAHTRAPTRRHQRHGAGAEPERCLAGAAFGCRWARE